MAHTPHVLTEYCLESKALRDVMCVQMCTPLRDVSNELCNEENPQSYQFPHLHLNVQPILASVGDVFKENAKCSAREEAGDMSIALT